MSKEEFRLLEKNFDSRFDTHEKRDDDRFKATEALSKERHDQLAGSLQAVRDHFHTLNGKLTTIFALPDRVDEIVDELEKVPRKQDLVHLTQTFTTRFDSFEKARVEEKAREDKAAVAFRWRLGIAITLGFPLVMLALNIAAKKMGWL